MIWNVDRLYQQRRWQPQHKTISMVMLYGAMKAGV
jgi:hypothetical protein